MLIKHLFSSCHLLNIILIGDYRLFKEEYKLVKSQSFLWHFNAKFNTA